MKSLHAHFMQDTLTSLKTPKLQSEAVNRKRTDKIKAK